MTLVTRPLRPEDIDESLDLVCCRPHFAERYSDTRAREAQTRAWRELMRRVSVCGGVVEVPERSPGQRLLIGGIAAFVKPEWIREYLADPFPFAGPWIIDRFIEGKDHIVLTDREMRQANSDGSVYLFILQHGWTMERTTGLDVFDVKQAAARNFTERFSGYRLAQVLQEVFRGFETEFHTSNKTWIERTDYDAYYSKRGEQPPEPRPVLIGLTREEARAPGADISRLAPLFVNHDVRFAFSPSQQRLLTLASLTTRDEDLAKELNVELNTLGRRLDRIYRRVIARQDPTQPVFPPNIPQMAKRRLLLDYLKDNVHELRPHAIRRKSGKGMEQSCP